jgi:uncharacterized protein (TIGR00299 family) protein
MQIQLDALGGVAGDMFVAAMLDAFPELEAGALASIGAVLGQGEARCRLIEHNDGVFRGRRFEVESAPGPADDPDHGRAPLHHHHHHDPGHDHAHWDDHGHEHHGHVDWSAIRARLQAAPLDEAVLRHALAIFTHLAEAEAKVHGVTPDQVRFHEVGAADSIADILGAAHVIAKLGAVGWVVSALPLGSGRVRTAHGLMPVPTPATVLLLDGFRFIDDGAPGERVTPTGAAILRHLCDPAADVCGQPLVLARSGVGFGTRVLPGISNCLRVLAFDEASVHPTWSERTLSVLEFDVDDQSAEDLAIALDHLRAHPEVIDAVQAPVFGKKGRMMTHVRLLVRAGGATAAADAVFGETTTIGLRWHEVRGAVLTRGLQEVEVGDARLRVKTALRPGGRTAKAEADDARSPKGHAARADLRRAAERAALAAEDPT